MIGERLKQVRLQMGLTQEQVGKIINRSKPFVCEVETGHAALSSDQLSTLAERLGVNEEWLATGTGSMTENESSRDRRTIGERIYQIRKQRHESQAQFALKLGVSRNTISLLERRKISASQGIIAAVVEKCGVSEVWLRTGESISRVEEIKDWLERCPADREKIREWLNTGA